MSISPPDIYRLLPQAPDAERGVLGSFLLSPDAVAAVCIEKGLTSAHFHLQKHALIYDALMSLNAARKPCDFVTLTQGFRDMGMLEDVGGAAYVTDLFTFLPTAANCRQYIETVIEKYALRETIRFCTEGAARSYDEQDRVWDLIEEHHTKMLRLVDLAKGRTVRLPGLRDLSQMLDDNMPALPSELVAGLLHQGSKLIIGGTSKGRKTWSLLDLAISVATGTDWWGMPCVQGRVCYINFEIQEPFFCRRIDKICRTKNLTLPPDTLMGWTLRGHAEGIEKMMAELMVVLMAGGFVLIIFDPIYKALGNRDENKAGDVASLCNELEKIAVKTGAAIAFGAHYSKGNQAAKESIDRIGGSGVFARDPDAILTMTPHEQEECFTVDCTLRNFAPMPAFVVKWDHPLFTRDSGLEPSKLKKPKSGRDATYDEDDLTAHLKHGAELSTTEWLTLVKDECGISERTFYAMKKQLVAKKIVRKCKLNGKWTLT